MKQFRLGESLDFPGYTFWLRIDSGLPVCRMDRVEFWRVVAGTEGSFLQNEFASHARLQGVSA